MLPNHHAFVAYGSPSKLKEFAAFIAKELGVTAAGNPDFHIRDYSRQGSEESDSFGIDEAQSITQLSRRTAVGEKKVFVIGAHRMTRAAQNALLKTLEEPTAHTVFAFLVPHGALIETVRSRVIAVPWNAQSLDDTFAKEFVASTPERRSQLIAGILKDKDKEGARELLDGVERICALKMQSVGVRKGLSELQHMRSYLTDSAPSLKMLLEHLALVFPTL